MVTQLTGHGFPVLATHGREVAANTIAHRTQRAAAWLSELLDFEPAIRLEVLGSEDWENRAQQPMYGMPHFGEDGTIYVAATYADLFADLVDLTMLDMPDQQRRRFTQVYGDPPNVSTFADLLSLHELGHLYHAQAGFDFGRWWLRELFCNIALEGYVVEEEPNLRPALETFPLAARNISPARIQVTAIDLMNTARGLDYGWYELQLHAAAVRIWANGGRPVLIDLYEQHRASSLRGSPVPFESLHPEIARVVDEWPGGD